MFDYPNIQISVKNKVSSGFVQLYVSFLILYFFLEICKFVLVIIFVMGSTRAINTRFPFGSRLSPLAAQYASTRWLILQ